MSVLDNVGSYARSFISNLLSKLDYLTIMSTSSCLFTIFPDQNCAVSWTSLPTVRSLLVLIGMLRHDVPFAVSFELWSCKQRNRDQTEYLRHNYIIHCGLLDLFSGLTAGGTWLRMFGPICFLSQQLDLYDDRKSQIILFFTILAVNA